MQDDEVVELRRRSWHPVVYQSVQPFTFECGAHEPNAFTLTETRPVKIVDGFDF